MPRKYSIKTLLPAELFVLFALEQNLASKSSNPNNRRPTLKAPLEQGGRKLLCAFEEKLTDNEFRARCDKLKDEHCVESQLVVIFASEVFGAVFTSR